MSGWNDVEQGRREWDWDVLVGDLDQASYLTSLGRDVARRAVVELGEFFGPGWLSRAANPVDPQSRIALAKVSPSLFAPSERQRDAFVGLLGWWGSVQVLQDAGAEGIGVLRRTMRSNPVRIELRHAVAQARLAAQALLAGARVTLEPEKPDGRPGDLRAVRGGTDVFLEYRAIDPDNRSSEHTRRMEEASMFLLMGGGQHGVTWWGDLPLDPDDAWYQRIREASKLCARTAAPVEVATADAVLRCTPGAVNPTDDGSGVVRWPPFDQDQHDRVMRALNAKGNQTRAAGAAWVWLEDGGALWPRTPFATSSLSDKIDTLIDVLGGFFAEHRHVLGVVITSGEPGPTGRHEASVRNGRGAGFVRLLPSGQWRESVVIQRPLEVPGQFALVCQLCADEPRWLDEALARLDAGCLQSLLASRPRSTGGLYLPGQAEQDIIDLGFLQPGSEHVELAPRRVRIETVLDQPVRRNRAAQ